MDKPETFSGIEQFLNRKPLIVSCEFIQGYTIPLNIKMNLGNEVLEYSSISGVFVYTNGDLPEILEETNELIDLLMKHLR